LTPTFSTIADGIVAARADWVSNPSVMATFRARRITLAAASAAAFPTVAVFGAPSYSGSVDPNSSCHSENNATMGRRSGCFSAMPRVTFFAPISAIRVSRRSISSNRSINDCRPARITSSPPPRW